MKRYLKRALVFTHDEVVEALSQYLESHHQASPANAMNLELNFDTSSGEVRLEWETSEEKVDLT